MNFNVPRTFQYSGKHVSDFHSPAENLSQNSYNEEDRYVVPIKIGKDSGKGNKWDRQMDIEEPLEREFILFAPEMTENHVQPKGKNTDQYDDKPRGGKIHSQKYLNYCRTVKLCGKAVNGE